MAGKIYKREDAEKSKTVLIVSIVIVVVFTLLGAVFPEKTGVVVYAINGFLCNDLGWLYLLMTAFFVFFGAYIAFSKYGKIRLGADDDKPEFSNFQWFALLFGGGIGIGLVFWGVAEPLMHYATGPMDDPYTQAAAETAIRIAFAHEGVHCWAMFGVVGLSLAYFQYRKKLPFLISSAFYPLIGNKIYGPVGKTVDIIAVFATVFGISTSLGLGAMQITGGMNYVWGVENSSFMTAIVIAIITVLFTLATASGLDKWMAKVVNLKVYLSIIFMLFLLLFGGTVYIMQMMSDVFGAYISKFVYQTFWYGNPGWLSNWTVFYWAWWIAWSPFCGQFFARVSKGRTVKEMVLGGTLLPAGFSFLWMVIYGAAGLNMDANTGGAISSAIGIGTASPDHSIALYALLQQLPAYEIMAPLALILVVLCFIGAADSATFVLPMLTMGGRMNPPKKARVFWGLAQGAVTIVLVLVGGQTALKVLQTSSIVAALPFMFIMLGLCIGVHRALKTEFHPELEGHFLLDFSGRRQRRAERKAQAANE